MAEKGSARKPLAPAAIASAWSEAIARALTVTIGMSLQRKSARTIRRRIPAVRGGHHRVREDDSGGRLRQDRYRFRDTPGLQRPKAGAGQDVRHRITIRTIIVDDQDDFAVAQQTPLRHRPVPPATPTA